MLNGNCETSGDLVRLLWRQMAVFPPSDLRLMSRKVNPQLHQESETYSWCGGNLKSGLRYARLMELLRVFCNQFRVLRNVFSNDLANVEMMKEHQRPPLEIFMIMDWILQGHHPQIQISTLFRQCEFCPFWLRYATLNEIILRVLWQMVQGCQNLVLKRWKFVWKARMHFYECFLGQNWWEFGVNHPASTGKRPLLFGHFSPLTTLCGDCIACNVHYMMTSWEKKSPLAHIGPATRLRKEPSGSLNVINCWICEPYKDHIWVKKNQIWQPVGAFWGLEIDSMDWLWDTSHTRTLARAVEAKLYVRPLDYIIRENGKSYTCSPEVSRTKQSLIFNRRQKKWKTKC